jgi:prepilin-type N-terminal cleavage/methylation domain-containing protein
MAEGIQEYIMFDHAPPRAILATTLSTGAKNDSVFSLLSLAYCRKRCRGFTLLELLVAMTLVALVTVIAATAFRLTVQAWERGAEEGESRQILSALPALLEKQLAARVVMPMFGQARVNPALYFCGGENSLSFITAYAPQGSELQGMLWVKYRFDPGQKMLFIYQRSVTRLEDLAIAETDSGVKHAEEGLPVSQIQGISDFMLAYAVELLYDPENSKQWQNTWDCGAESVGVPFGLMLKMTIGEGARSRSFSWIYRVGDQQSASPFGGR